MVVIICGDRKWGDYRCDRCQDSVFACPSCTTLNMRYRDAILREIKAHNLVPEKDVIIHGAANGADRIAGEWARKLGFKLGTSLREFPAQWGTYGRAAGPIRNRQMLKEDPDLVLAFHPEIGKSRGTADMIGIARTKGVEVKVFQE